MSKKSSRLAAVVVCCVLLCAGCLSAGVFDKINEAEKLYGKGVHAFFDGNYQGAVELLAKVEELGSEDPRPYFFLGLAQHRLGEKDQAEATFKKAAKFEWEGRRAVNYKVSEALKRIQGKERLDIDAFRRQARLDWEKADQARQQVRYGQEKDKDRSILAQLAKGSELPRPKQQPFVGQADFGARSVDPHRNPDGTDDPDKLIPLEDDDDDTGKDGDDDAGKDDDDDAGKDSDDDTGKDDDGDTGKDDDDDEMDEGGSDSRSLFSPKEEEADDDEGDDEPVKDDVDDDDNDDDDDDDDSE